VFLKQAFRRRINRYFDQLAVHLRALLAAALDFSKPRRLSGVFRSDSDTENTLLIAAVLDGDQALHPVAQSLRVFRILAAPPRR
jgi:hypothetical protein